MVKIAIFGKANSGKNTIANMIVKNLGFPGSKEKITAFADPIKHIVKTMFPDASNECLFGPSALRSVIISDKYVGSNNKPLTHRQPLLDIGALGRSYNKDFWIHFLVDDSNRNKDIDTYIISDGRYMNEFEFLKKEGFIMLRIIRTEVVSVDHISETGQDSIPDSSFDFVVHNNNTLTELDAQINCLSSKLTQY